ncbi:MAG: hypothetical protein LBG80_11345 [Bacteroidales bacterium]|jgi:hypothetical protein|nr:hypothetical protein [Bacteroidales bacterium]
MKSKSNKNRKNKQGFIHFLIGKDQYFDWLLLVIVCLAGYLVVKSGYPYPITMSDSGGYIQAAKTDMFSFYRPFGYSVLLQLIHTLSSSIHAIFIVQMLLYFISASIFAFTVKYFFAPAKKIVWYFLLFFFVFSPMAFILANAIMSDLLFGIVIYIMLASFIFIVKQGKWIALITFLLAVFCSLYIRYSAMVFPVIFLFCFLWLRGKIRWISIAGLVIVSVIFYNQMKDLMKETTEFDQFSTGFDGWQLANNAMHILPFIDLDSQKISDKKMRELHQFSLPYKDTILESTNHGSTTTVSFLWDPAFPLKMFVYEEMRKQQRSYAHLWIELGTTTFKEYGQYLILRYPWKFMRYYYFPNMKHVFFLYNPGIISSETSITTAEAYEWYKIDESQDLTLKNPFYKGIIWNFMQVLWTLRWIFILGLSLWAVLWRKRIKYNNADKIVFWSLFVFGAIYYASTVFASPIEDRYWFPTECILFSFCYILCNKLVLCMQSNSLKNNQEQAVISNEKPVIPKQKKGKKNIR